ncbi:MAG TPA: hypothetical protein VFP61_06305, partial [Acidimicrobiales bacterium]|nr:hypothetical protein [Acidimicrobiales bacterium]
MPASPAVPSDSALLRAGGRGDEAALRGLVARHGALCWRLANAITPVTGQALAAVADGTSTAVASARRQRAGGPPVRSQLLAATYRAALARAAQPGALPHASAGAAALPLDHAAALAGLRALPERWRAAVWLHEVEGLEPATVAAALDTSPAVALQLTIRGRRSLLSRCNQGADQQPAALGALLAPLVPESPPDLTDVVVSAWRTHAARGGGSARRRWLAERAPGPLAAAAGAVAAIGLIGVGVLGDRTGVTGGIAVRPASTPGADASGLLGLPGGGFGGLRALLLASPFVAPPASTPVPTSVASPGLAPGGPGATGPSPTGQGATPVAPVSGGTAPSAPTVPPTGLLTSPTTPPVLPPTTVAAGPVTVASGGGSTSIGAGPAAVTVGSCTSIDLLGAT